MKTADRWTNNCGFPNENNPGNRIFIATVSRRQALDVLSAAESVLPISDSEVTCGPMAKPATLN